LKPITVPDYQLIEKCGRGSFGDVYVARGLSGSLVALKVIEKNNYSAKEFNGLKYYCSRCSNSPFLIKIYHTGETESFFYYTMELADNLGDDDHYIPATLANRLVDDQRLSPPIVKDLALNLLSGLETLHRSGLVHRDIKPENVIFVNNVPKLSDIGLVSSVSAAFSVGGTLGFIPPEKLKSSSGSKTATDDLYALGKLIYCTLSGNSPEKFPSLPQDIGFDDEVKRLNEVILIACNSVGLLRFNSINQFRRTLTSSVWRRRRALHLLWSHRYYLLTGIILVLALILLLNPSITNSYFMKKYVDIASCSTSGPKISVPNNNMVIPAKINDADFKTLLGRQLDMGQLVSCTFKVNSYLDELARKRYPELQKEYSAYLADIAAIEELISKYHPGMVAELKTLVKNCASPMDVPKALVSWLSPEMWNDKKIYDLYCDCAIRSENMEVIFLEKRNKLPEALEWDKFLFDSRLRNKSQNHPVLYRTPNGRMSPDFEEVLAAYHKQLQTMSPKNQDHYSQLAKDFLGNLRSHVSSPAIITAENTYLPIELHLEAAKAIQAYAQNNMNGYVLVKYGIPNSFYRTDYGKQSYGKLKKITREDINNLPAVLQGTEWVRKKSERIGILREEELKNTSNHNAVFYLKAKKLLTPFLDISLTGKPQPDQ